MIGIDLMQPQLLVPQRYRHMSAGLVEVHPVVLGHEVGADMPYLDEGMALPDVGFTVAQFELSLVRLFIFLRIQRDPALHGLVDPAAEGVVAEGEALLQVAVLVVLDADELVFGVVAEPLFQLLVLAAPDADEVAVLVVVEVTVAVERQAVVEQVVEAVRELVAGRIDVVELGVCLVLVRVADVGSG